MCVYAKHTDVMRCLHYSTVLYSTHVLRTVSTFNELDIYRCIPFVGEAKGMGVREGGWFVCPIGSFALWGRLVMSSNSG